MVTNGPVELGNFWEFAYINLLNDERERFSSLQHVWTDRGKTRSLIRAALNERSLARYLDIWLADASLDKSYESWALMRDQESAAMLSSMASGLNSILFALSIDSPELNAVRLVRDTAKPEPIIAAPTPAAGNSSGSSTKKKAQRQIIDLDKDDDDEGNDTSRTPILPVTTNNLSSQCLKEETKEEKNSPDQVTPSQVFNVPEELPTEIQTFVCRSTPTSSRMSTSITSQRSMVTSTTARTELFPDPPNSSCFIYPTADDPEPTPLLEQKNEESVENHGSDSSSKRSSVHSSAVSLDVDVDRLKNRLKDTEERCQYLESRVAELSLENHRLRGLSNSPRGGLTCFTVSVPRVHLESNKYYVYEIHIIPTYGGDEWTIRRRYRDFYELHQEFQKTNAGVKALDFPPKKKFGNMVRWWKSWPSMDDNLILFFQDASFVEQRRQRLQVYLRHLLAILPEVSACNTRTQLEQVFPFFK